jgi:hypothetical protein
VIPYNRKGESFSRDKHEGGLQVGQGLSGGTRESPGTKTSTWTAGQSITREKYIWTHFKSVNTENILTVL